MTADRAFAALRPFLRSLAYRMLGSVADAEDIVQEAFVRWQRADDVRSPRAYLTAVVTRLCIDHKRSAHARRENAVELPEPIAEALPGRAESLSIAFLVLLEALSPVERAVFVLHHAFDLEYAEIAAVVGKSEDNCRQIGHRAAAAIAARTPRFPSTREARHALANAFAEASRSGSLARLAALFAEEATLIGDGGAAAPRFGRTRVASRPIAGRRAITRFLANVLAGWPAGFASRVGELNGEPALIGTIGDAVVSAIAFDVRDGLIAGLYIVADPAKLTRVC